MFSNGRILSFVLTFVVASSALYGLTMVYSILSKPFWHSNVWLHEFEESIKKDLVLGLLVILILAFFVKQFFKTQRPAASLAVALAGIGFVILLSVHGWRFFNGSKFDEHQWTAAQEKPFAMARKLIQDRAFIGLDSLQLRKKFGACYSCGDRKGTQQINFSVQGNWELVLLLNGDVVIAADLRR
ncbi:MAG: hypothetical protein EOP06_07650 [Proteobacteria bacterium]|nr:MAG: hypothetical protein EOP06_07650 [Pseudomonadota bacterium]